MATTPEASRPRDRHGRGLRGALAPAGSPTRVTRTGRFARVVVDAVDRLEPNWSRYLTAVDINIVDTPPLLAGTGNIPLAGHQRSLDGRTVTVVIYRRPVELRARDYVARLDLVRDLVVEELALALDLEPGDLDPGYVPGD